MMETELIGKIRCLKVIRLDMFRENRKEGG